MATSRPHTADLLNPVQLHETDSGRGELPPVEDAEAVAARLVDWRAAYRPESAEENWLFEQAVVNSVRVDTCQRAEVELCARRARRASLAWDADRRADAETTAARLSRDPARVSSVLQRSKHGCEWLLDRWRLLASTLADAGAWTKAQHALAMNLLGTPPEFRDGRARQSPPEKIVSDEIARLERLKAESLDELDATDRAAAEQGLEAEPCQALTRLRHYEAACMRRYQWARARLQGRRDSPSVAEEAPPHPATTDDAYREYERQAIRLGIETYIARHSEPPPEPEPEVEVEVEVETPAALVPVISGPVAEVVPVPLNNITPSRLPYGNRKTRRAAEKMIKRR